MFSLQSFLTDWQLDIVSLLIGVLVGIVVTVVARRLAPHGRRWTSQGWLRLRYTWGNLRSGLEGRYREETAAYAQQLHLGRQWATLDQVFVPPYLLAPPPTSEPEAKPLGVSVQLNYLWPELAARMATPLPPLMHLSELLLNGRRVLITAPAGAGKSTLLAYAAYRCAVVQPEDPDAFLLPMLPVLVHLAELDLLASDNRDPLAPLVAALQNRSRSAMMVGLKRLLSQKAEAGDCLLLLDGWDALAETDRPTATAWLQQLLQTYPKLRVIMAAPLTGYGSLLELAFTVTGILPWRLGQVERLAAQWTRAIPLSQAPRVNRFWQPGQSALKNALCFWRAALGQDAYGNAARKPQREADLLRDSLTYFGGVGDTPAFSAEIDSLTLAFWQKIAFTLVQGKKLSLTADELTAVARETVQMVQGKVESPVLVGLRQSVADCDLFVTWGNGRVSLISTLWRDYLAAGHMVQQEMMVEAQANLRDPHWAGVIRHYVSEAGAAPLAELILNSKETTRTRDDLFQVASWMPVAPGEGDWRRQTLILLGQIIRQSSFAQALRQRAVAALAQSGDSSVLVFLSQLLERSDPFLRRAGTAALSHLSPERVIDLLTGMMEDGDTQVRETAVAALTWIYHPATEEPILNALIHGDAGVSEEAARGLALNGKEGLEILKEALDDQESRVRRAAVRGLALLEEASWLKSRLRKMERYDEDPKVRAAAAEALETWRARRQPSPWEPVQPHKQSWLISYTGREGRAVPTGSAALPFLVQILTDSPDPALRRAAVTTLGQMARVHDAIPALETAVRDTDKQVREAAFISLCRFHRAYNHAAAS